MFGIAGKNGRQRRGSRDSWGYRIHDGASQFRFELEGTLASGDVAELDQCWHTAASTIAGKAFVVDLTSLEAIDESGRELLSRWREAGAEFVAGGESASLLAESIGAEIPVRAMHAPPSRFMLLARQSALPLLAVLLTLLLSAALQAKDSGTTIPSPEPATAANQVLARYFAGLESSQPWGSENVEIEAALPKLKEHGRLRAIRRLLPLGKPQYQVVELDGSRTVKQQVIARYLSAEMEAAAMNPSAVAVTPANYLFHYEGSVEGDGGLTYIFQITPRKNRAGLIRGMVWIDAGTGSAVRLSGYLVKRPSIFIKRVDVTRETNLQDGVATSRVTHLALDTRLVGRAELTIHERPCVECTETVVSGSNGSN